MYKLYNEEELNEENQDLYRNNYIQIDRQIDYIDRQMDKVNDRQIDIQNKILYSKKVNF